MSNAEDVPSFRDFDEWSVKIAGYWFRLGTELDVPNDRLTNININIDQYRTHESRAFEMLRTWKAQGGASYRKMADALRGLGEVEFADNICPPGEDDSHSGARMGQATIPSHIHIHTQIHLHIHIQDKGAVDNNGNPVPEESRKTIMKMVGGSYIDEQEHQQFRKYLQEQINLQIDAEEISSLRIRVRCTNLEILEGLWQDYTSGKLNEVAEKYLVTNEVLSKYNLREMTLRTIIEDEEYRRCRKHLQEIEETGQTLTPGNKEAMQQPKVPFARIADFRDTADAVCQIETRDNVLCTGFYATVNVDGLAVCQGIFTANHVIPSSIEAEHATFNFGYEHEVNKRGHKIQLKPRIFRTNEDLDYSFIGVDVDQLPDVQPIKFEKETDVNPGDEAIRIIQHPKGRPKEFAYGKITEVNRPFVHYNVNTEPGSSGSPVLKNMKVIAIHHRGATDESNWGTLCSAVIKHLTTGEYSGTPNPTNTGSTMETAETRKKGSSADRHDREPTNKDLLLVQSVGNKYEELGMYLGVPRQIMEDINGNANLQEPSKKALKMLQDWCKWDEAPSCMKLAEGLRIPNVGLPDLAKKLLKQL